MALLQATLNTVKVGLVKVVPVFGRSDKGAQGWCLLCGPMVEIIDILFVPRRHAGSGFEGLKPEGLQVGGEKEGGGSEKGWRKPAECTVVIGQRFRFCESRSPFEIRLDAR
jgi:hypothetical protein